MTDDANRRADPETNAGASPAENLPTEPATSHDPSADAAAESVEKLNEDSPQAAAAAPAATDAIHHPPAADADAGVSATDSAAAGPSETAASQDGSESTTTKPSSEDASSGDTSAKSGGETASEDSPSKAGDASGAGPTPTARREIKIGSQRDPSVAKQLKARPQHIDVDSSDAAASGQPSSTGTASTFEQKERKAAQPQRQFPPPRLEPKLTPEMQQELEAAMGDVSIDDLMSSGASAAPEELTEGAPIQGRVLLIRNENVFVDIGQRHQGVIALKQFEQAPEIGSELTVTVGRFDAGEGIYELTIPDAAVDVSSWEDIEEGMVVEAVVTGHNKGGLECTVSNLRGFIPLSQVALYRVENVEDFVGQRFPCVITEVKPERRNLVVSRRAMLERERAEAKRKLLEELEVGQLREGTVTRIQPFGAFVDLGGVDGLVHISQLSWDRINDPSEVVQVGQQIKVKVTKINPETGKIGLAYRDTFENPWDKAAENYKPKTRVTGTVTRLTDFGAFVRLEAGIEGLVHVSELAYSRVWRPSDVLSEGQEIEVLVLSVDAPQQRIGLSLKALQEKPKAEPKRKEEEPDAIDPQEAAARAAERRKHQESLKGGVDRPAGGAQFGLKW